MINLPPVADDAEKKIVQQARCTCSAALAPIDQTHDVPVCMPHTVLTGGSDDTKRWRRDQERDPRRSRFDVHVLDGLEPRAR